MKSLKLTAAIRGLGTMVACPTDRATSNPSNSAPEPGIKAISDSTPDRVHFTPSSPA